MVQFFLASIAARFLEKGTLKKKHFSRRLGRYPLEASFFLRFLIVLFFFFL